MRPDPARRQCETEESVHSGEPRAKDSSVSCQLPAPSAPAVSSQQRVAGSLSFDAESGERDLTWYNPLAHMVRGLDALTSLTLKHVRERWWNDAFGDFLEGALKPKPGKRILDVGCGVGTAEISLARLQVSQLRLFGVDTITARVGEALSRVRGINARAGFAAADAVRLPYVNGAFDCTFCVAVLQHVRDVPMALSELARVTRPGGRILAVEPDNAARYWYSSLPSGVEAFELGRRFFTALALARGEAPPAAIAPALPGRFSAAGTTPPAVGLVPA